MYEDVLQKNSSRIFGQVPTIPFLILYGDIPIGYIQTCRIKDHPDYNRYVQADEDTMGVDLFIGERAYSHRGYGSAALTKFLAEVVFADSSINNCIVGPEPRNKAAIKCYEKAGFRYFKSIHLPGEPESEYLMRISRAALGPADI